MSVMSTISALCLSPVLPVRSKKIPVKNQQLRNAFCVCLKPTDCFIKTILAEKIGIV